MNPLAISSALLVVFIIVIVGIYYRYHSLFVLTFWSELPIFEGRYGSYLPKYALNDELRYRGLPSDLDRSYGGAATWKNTPLYRLITVKDTPIPVDKPSAMFKSVFYTLRFNKIKPDMTQLDTLLTLYTWEETSSMIQVGHYFMGGCQVLCWLFLKLIRGELKTPLETYNDYIDKVKSNPAVGFNLEAELIAATEVLPNNKAAMFS